MKDKQQVMGELDSYRYDYQYFLEKTKDIEKLKTDVEKMWERMKVMKDKKDDLKKLDEQMQEVMDEQLREEETLLRLMAKKQRVEKNIEALPQPYRYIFFMKYVRLMSFCEIAAKLNYSTKRIYQLHQEGLTELVKSYS